jgi:predicted nucleic acid-binding protein
MNADKAFVDTNIFVYLYSDTDEFKKRRAFSFMSQYDCKISTQVLNEFCHTCIRKLKAPIDGVRLSIEKICSLHDVAYISEDTIEQALRILRNTGTRIMTV